jgi:hypothetical protein
MDVPHISLQPTPLLLVELIALPGPKMSMHGPRELKSDTLSVLSIEPTVKDSGAPAGVMSHADLSAGRRKKERKNIWP